MNKIGALLDKRLGPLEDAVYSQQLAEATKDLPETVDISKLDGSARDKLAFVQQLTQVIVAQKDKDKNEPAIKGIPGKETSGAGTDLPGSMSERAKALQELSQASRKKKGTGLIVGGHYM